MQSPHLETSNLRTRRPPVSHMETQIPTSISIHRQVPFHRRCQLLLKHTTTARDVDKSPIKLRRSLSVQHARCLFITLVVCAVGFNAFAGEFSSLPDSVFQHASMFNMFMGMAMLSMLRQWYLCCVNFCVAAVLREFLRCGYQFFKLFHA
ncbi:hypothetical protein ZEAMMB73_Zm00001d028269 [Zea mays]|uniref:Uncharacterized protein n=1 Tax=Zea mays TaxID=4577 RepID=A0A1D6JU43_MAIZE|nr:hypothetical protein ZEAMMB73_Zm00001d028269 [Zea mays]